MLRLLLDSVVQVSLISIHLFLPTTIYIYSPCLMGSSEDGTVFVEIYICNRTKPEALFQVTFICNYVFAIPHCN